jgi:S-formylglutathione hydrolase FrmB
MRFAKAVVAVALVSCAFAPGAYASELVDIPIPARGGEIDDRWLPRYPEGGPPHAKVLLPDGYDPKKAYPLLVLLIGLNSHYDDWSDAGAGEIQETAKGFPGIIVMPEGGDGWYADWWNNGTRGDPAWESYHLDQVIPQIEERYRIRPERRWHAIAGVSMGGLGAIYLGGRLPGYFGSVASFSGFLDLEQAPAQTAIQSAISTTVAGQPPAPQGIYGPEGGFYHLGHNPVRLVNNLKQSRVFVATGTGDGPLEVDSSWVGRSEEMLIIYPQNESYAAALRESGVDHTYIARRGFHDWRYFRPMLRDAITWGLFRRVDENPRRWVNDTVATHGDVWGFDYRFDAPPDQVVRFERAGRRLSVSAAGSPVTLTTEGGCVWHVATPAAISVPRKRC